MANTALQLQLAVLPVTKRNRLSRNLRWCLNSQGFPSGTGRDNSGFLHAEHSRQLLLPLWNQSKCHQEIVMCFVVTTTATRSNNHELLARLGS